MRYGLKGAGQAEYFVQFRFNQNQSTLLRIIIKTKVIRFVWENF